MKSPDIKTEIFKVIDKLPAEYLPEILAYLKQIQLSDHINKIIDEDKELLKKLAK